MNMCAVSVHEQWLAKHVGLNDFGPSDALTKLLARLLCGNPTTDPICANLMFLLGGKSAGQLNEVGIISGLNLWTRCNARAYITPGPQIEAADYTMSALSVWYTV